MDPLYITKSGLNEFVCTELRWTIYVSFADLNFDVWIVIDVHIFIKSPCVFLGVELIFLTVDDGFSWRVHVKISFHKPDASWFFFVSQPTGIPDRNDISVRKTQKNLFSPWSFSVSKLWRCTHIKVFSDGNSYYSDGFRPTG